MHRPGTRVGFDSISEARALAKRRMPRVVFDFIDGGADDEVTMAANRRAFDECELVPRLLRPDQPPRTAVEVAGTQLALPLAIGPTGLAGITGPQADIAGMTAAARMDTAFTLSTLANSSIEDVRRASAGDLWMQCYVWHDRDAVEALMKRALAAQVAVLVLTIDTPDLGNRERDRRNGFGFPPKPSVRGVADLVTHPRWLASMRNGIEFPNVRVLGDRRPRRLIDTLREAEAADKSLYDCRVKLSDLEWVRERWPGKLLIKGVLSPDDARVAVDAGADGLVVSNHGGRQLDGAIASLRALPAVVGAVSPDIDVLVDSGVRRGSDIVKALCLGAKACLIGRAWLYGFAAAGRPGVEHVLSVLADEFRRTLTLVGADDPSDLDRSWIRTPW